MDKEAYDQAQRVLCLCAAMIQTIELEDFVLAADRADAFGPTLDPTLWTKGHKRLEAIRELAVVALAFKGAARQFDLKMAAIVEQEGMPR